MLNYRIDLQVVSLEVRKGHLGRSGGLRREAKRIDSFTLAKLAQVIVHHPAIASYPIQFRLIVADPFNEIARLLDFAGFVQVIEIFRENSITLFQLFQRGIKTMNIADYLLQIHEPFHSANDNRIIRTRPDSVKLKAPSFDRQESCALRRMVKLVIVGVPEN